MPKPDLVKAGPNKENGQPSELAPEDVTGTDKQPERRMLKAISHHPALHACALIAGLYALCGAANALSYLLTGVAP